MTLPELLLVLTLLVVLANGLLIAIVVLLVQAAKRDAERNK